MLDLRIFAEEPGKSVQYGLYCITNFIWTISLYLSNATGYVVQQAYKLDFINDMADSIGKSIQTLAGVTENGFGSTGFYVGFLLLIILIVGIYVAYTGLIKRETSKALHAVINFVVVFIVSASFIAYAPDYIKKINDFSSDISTASLDLGTKIMLPDSNSQGKDSVDLIRDSLFSIQVQQPWLLLQFGNSDIEEIGADRVEALVSVSPSADDGATREDVVKTEIEDNDNDNLTIPQVINRLGMVFFLLIFNLGITIFVFLLTGMMIFSQILFIIFAMFLPISFLLSMIPSYENMAKQAIVRVFNTIMTRAGHYPHCHGGFQYFQYVLQHIHRLPVLYDCVLADSLLCGYLHEAGRPYEYVQFKCWGQPEHGTQDIPSPVYVHATQG